MIRILAGNFDYSLSNISGILPANAAELKAIIKTPYTYNSATKGSADTFSLRATSAGASAFGALLHSDSAISLPSGIISDTMARGVQPVILQANSSGVANLSTNAKSLITLQAGKFFVFPPLPKSSFSPPKLNRKINYSNNKSEGGQFLGASITRSGASVTLSPLNFAVDAARVNEIEELFELLEAGPFFVAHDLPDGMMSVYYGWLNREPRAEFTGTLNRFEITLEMDVAV